MIAETLAQFAQCRSVPDPALAVLRLSLLDWCAVGIAGRDEPVSRILRAQALEEGGAGQAGLIADATRVPARMAALVNGATSHALDYDDTHFAHIGHPSVAVIPAALSVAQLVDASGAELQEAALVGAEASIRVGLRLGRAHYQAGFHQTATAGAFGSTVAAARLLGLSPQQTLHALGLVSTRASGLKSQFGTMGKPLNAGLAAANGVEAAMLAAKGMESRAEAVEGPQGFAATHQAEGKADAFEDLGQSWLFEEVSHKFHACCHGLHATLEALTPVIGTDAAQIDRIEIATHSRWLSVCNIATPATGLEAKFSYAMVAAMRLMGIDTARPDSFAGDVCRDPALVALRDKVSVTGEGGLSEMQARVSLRMSDGATRVLEHDLSSPISLAERQARIQSKMRALLGKEREAALWSLIASNGAPDEIAACLR